MKEQIKIAIFGLSLTIEENLKQKIQSLFDDSVKVEWVTLNSASIDVLLVNDLFLNSKIVQSHIQKKVPYLRLLTNENRSGQIENDTLYLPFIINDETKGWFNKRYLEVPVNFQSFKTSIENTSTANVDELDFKAVIAEFFNEENGTIQVFDQYGELALMNTKTEQVWIDQTRKEKCSYSTLNFTYATMQMSQKVSNQQGVDLHQWLWNALWDSKAVVENQALDKTYTLEIWPQPSELSQRNDIFKIAAYFEQGATGQQVQQKTGLDLRFIHQFISVSLLSRAMRA